MSNQPQFVVVKEATNGIGLAGLIFSILGWLTCGLLCLVGAPLSFLGLFSKGPKGTAIAGLIVGFPGVLFFVFIGIGLVASVLGIGATAASVGVVGAIESSDDIQRTPEAQAKVDEMRSERAAQESEDSGTTAIVDDAMHGPTETSRQDDSSPKDAVAREAQAIFADQMTKYQQKLAKWEASQAIIKSETARKAELTKAIATHKGTEPPELTFESRVWETVGSTSQTTATLVTTDNVSVTLRNAAGKEIDVPKDRLNAVSRIYVQNSFDQITERMESAEPWAEELSRLESERTAANDLIAENTSSEPKPPVQSEVTEKLKAEIAFKAKAEAAEREREAQRIANAPKMNKANFDRCQTGMTYAEVTAIVGDPYDVVSDVQIAGSHTVMVVWKAEGFSNANMTFQDGRLIAKAQLGL